MARHDSNYDLTDTEKRDLIKLIEQGKTREVCTSPPGASHFPRWKIHEATDLGKFGIHTTRKRLIEVLSLSHGAAGLMECIKNQT